MSTFSLPMPHLKTLTPTPILYGVGTRDTNCPPDLALRHFGELSEPKELVIVDADHYEILSVGREVLHPREVAFLKRTLLA